MKKIGKLGLTIAMVLAMAIGTTATAFADTTAATVTQEGTAISKTYTAAEASLLTETEFKYNLTYTGATKINGNETTNPANVTQNVANEITLTLNQKEENATSVDGSMTYAELFEGITFSAPGRYYFTLSEVEGNNPDIAYDKSSYTIEVQVVWDDVDAGTVKVQSVNTYKDEVKTTSGATFTNGAKENGTLTVEKIIAGNAANTDNEFTFTVTLTGVSETGSYTATINDNPAEAAQKGANTYVLGHKDKLVISNLPVGATYTVTEADATETNGVYVVDGYTVTDNVGGTGDNNANGSMTEDGANVTFTNTKNAEVITGVFMDVLPYALIVVVAAAACFFFMTRRRNREDY